MNKSYLVLILMSLICSCGVKGPPEPPLQSEATVKIDPATPPLDPTMKPADSATTPATPEKPAKKKKKGS